MDAEEQEELAEQNEEMRALLLDLYSEFKGFCDKIETILDKR